MWSNAQRQKLLLIPLLLLTTFSVPLTSNKKVSISTNTQAEAPITVPLSFYVQNYLNAQNSPLVDHVDVLLAQKHWKLILAISNAEGQFCQHQLDFNCWGIGGEQNFKHFKSYPESLKFANDFLESWQVRGKWLTVESMNCSYVSPCSKNWVNTVNKTLKELEVMIK